MTHHENYNEDEADSNNDEKWDEIIFQRQTEVRHENHMTAENTNTVMLLLYDRSHKQTIYLLLCMQCNICIKCTYIFY